MAYTKSSNLITNLDASPIVQNDVGLSGGRVRICMDSFETGTLVDTNTLALCRLPAACRIISIKLFNDDLGDAIPVDVGIYTTAGVAKDSDEFAIAVTMATASTNANAQQGHECRFEAAVTEFDALSSRLYTLAGDSAGDEEAYDIVVTVNGTVTNMAAGTMGFMIMYVVD